MKSGQSGEFGLDLLGHELLDVGGRSSRIQRSYDGDGNLDFGTRFAVQIEKGIQSPRGDNHDQQHDHAKFGYEKVEPGLPELGSEFQTLKIAAI